MRVLKGAFRPPAKPEIGLCGFVNRMNSHAVGIQFAINITCIFESLIQARKAQGVFKTHEVTPFTVADT